MSYHHPEQVQTFQYPQNNYYPQNVGHGYNSPNQMYTRPNKKHQCNFCAYASDRKPDVKRHVEKKHPGMGSVQPAGTHKYASNPHPYVHPYLNHANQQPNTYPPRTAEMVANNTYYAKEVRAPTKVSVGPDWQSAPTEIRVGPNEPMPPTTLSVPPVREQVQHGGGITIKIDDEDDTDVDDEDMDTDDEDDTDEDDEEEQGPGVFDVLVDIAKTFKYLKDLRKQYRDLLPQLKEMNQCKMGCFLQAYSHVKTIIIEEQDGLEGTVFKKQHGKGVTESEGETDEETDNENDGNDADTEDDNDTEEETVDSEEEETEENDDDDDEESDQDMDVKFDAIQEDESNKEPFFNFVFEAEHFLDAKSKATLEEYLARDKKNRKLDDGCDQDETDNPENVQEVVGDIEEVFSMWNEKEEDCFKQCSKRKIQSVCNVAYNWMDATSLNKMKKFNPSKYRFLKKMLSPHKNSLEKLVDSNVSIHEKRKTLQKAQVGDGILQMASHLMLPLLRQALK